ncbi:hypothetical protein E2562_009409 [Oryza meyeriana var. granulata]|uniref:Uncharacterized protein n=1 Tax=Oryza meyeriana var. granulata TaxID=110450 RepID=A0A6G1BU07_9ORYZ|nr:hypothetical protein E2562_009409 [Oryza meyeriana var. granulata]
MTRRDGGGIALLSSSSGPRLQHRDAALGVASPSVEEAVAQANRGYFEKRHDLETVCSDALYMP